MAVGQCQQLVATVRDQRLVGRDHVLAGADRGSNELARLLHASHQLHHHLYRGIRQHLAVALHQQLGGHRPRLAEIGHADPYQFHPHPEAARPDLAVGRNETREGSSRGTQPHQADADPT